jgi:hypothetical protein
MLSPMIAVDIPREVRHDDGIPQAIVGENGV